MNPSILAKIEAHVPALSELIQSYRMRHESNVRAAIINTVLGSEVRYLDREEVLYLAWFKADHDKKRRDQDDDLRQRWARKQRQMRARPTPRPARVARVTAKRR